MSNPFFDRPIINSPYAYPSRHWELDDSGQPTQRILETRRHAEFITPIPKPKKQKGAGKQESLLFDEGLGLSGEQQGYDHTAIINAVRLEVDRWRQDPDPNHIDGSRQRPRASFSTGAITPSPASAPSSARWRPLKPPSG
nr:hypothetical protein [Thiorhodococcus mannitoliphagus]